MSTRFYRWTRLAFWLLAFTAAYRGDPVAQTAPVLTVRQEQNELRLAIDGTTNEYYQVDYSVGLGSSWTWTPWTNLFLLSTSNEFTLPLVPETPVRFIRVASVTPDTKPGPDPTNMVWVRAGTFVMGSAIDENRMQPMFPETPLTTITLTNGFWVSAFKVTQREYFDVMGTNPSGFATLADHWECPVEQVSYADSSNYCARVTLRERLAGRLPDGYTYRLPTEAEWEYAARAGTSTRFFFGDYPDYMNSPTNTPLGDYAWYWKNAGKRTHPVGLKKPNPWGLYDVYGNVCEWVIDRVAPYTGGSLTNPVVRSGTNALGITFGEPYRQWGLFRAGSWNNADLRGLRSAARIGQWRTLRYHDLGFRIVLAPVIPSVWPYRG